MIPEPPITLMARNHGGAVNLPVVRIVIHDEEYPFGNQSAEAIAQMFATTTRDASAHYVVDADSTQHCVPENTVAYHAPPNTHSIGIERDGFATFTRDQWLSDYGTRAGLRQAELVAELCVRHQIPPRRLSVEQVHNGERGVCGHVDVTNAFHMSTHTDPGPGFPWDEFMACVVDAYNRLTGAPPQEGDDVAIAKLYLAPNGTQFVCDGVIAKPIPSLQVLQELRALGIVTADDAKPVSQATADFLGAGDF